jgi:membrane associated rhomboid family serine protease
MPSFAFPRPGRALKGLLILLAVVSLVSAIIKFWLPGGETGHHLIHDWLAFHPTRVFKEPWLLVAMFTSGFLTVGLKHIFYSLIGLYFLSPDLERRWGGARFIRFIVTSMVVGNLLVLLVDQLPTNNPIFHPDAFPRSIVGCFGPGAALAATAIAWSRENQNAQVRLFLVLPVGAKLLFWVTIAFCVLGVVYHEDVPEGAFGPIGGVMVGMLMSGSPSLARSLWLRLRLANMRRKGAAISVDDILEPPSRPRPTTKRKGGPPLRVVPGGLEDELKNRKPPKDKRYLN